MQSVDLGQRMEPKDVWRLSVSFQFGQSTEWKFEALTLQFTSDDPAPRFHLAQRQPEPYSPLAQAFACMQPGDSIFPSLQNNLLR